MKAWPRAAAYALGWLLLAGALSWAPFGGYATTLLTEAIILSLWAVSYNLVYGYMGEISFGHAAFFGIGAYAQPLLTDAFHLPFGLNLLLAMGVAGAGAGAMSLIIRRTRGVYYAVLTFALAEVIFMVAIKWTDFTGGDNGLAVGRAAWLERPETYVLVVLSVVTMAMLALRRIVDSPAGRVVQAIRQNEQRARQIGYNTTAYRALAFTISGTFSGLAGALYSPLIHFVSPDVLFWTSSGQVIIMTIIGGSAAFFGPVLGALVFVVLRDTISSWSASSATIAGIALSRLGEHWPLFMGVVFFLIVVFEPGGLVGIYRRLRSWSSRVGKKSLADAIAAEKA